MAHLLGRGEILSMFIEFDFHSDSNCMAIVQRLPDGSKNMVIYDLTAKNLIGEVDAYCLPSTTKLSSSTAPKRFKAVRYGSGCGLGCL